MKKVCLCLVALLVGTTLLSGCGKDSKPEQEDSKTPSIVTGDEAKIAFNKSIDPDTINLIQLEEPDSNTSYAVIETTAGNIKLRLFEEQAPLAVANFKDLVQSAFYDDQIISEIISKERVVLGHETDEVTAFQDEYSMDLWHFYGAVAMDNQGKTDNNTAMFYIVQNSSLHPDILEEMEEVGFPQKVTDQYKTVGGTPFGDHRDTVFAHVVEGMDVVEKIAATEDGAEPVKIVKITIE